MEANKTVTSLIVTNLRYEVDCYDLSSKGKTTLMVFIIRKSLLNNFNRRKN